MYKQYPKTINGKQCIGPCYPKGTLFANPQTLTLHVGETSNVCPINPYIWYDPLSGKKYEHETERCEKPTVVDTGEIGSLDFIFPTIEFSSDYFIKKYYDIMSLEELIKWLDMADEKPYDTKIRVFDNGIYCFGKEMNIVDYRIVKYVGEIFEHNIPKIYKNIRKYIMITDQNVTLIDPVDRTDKVDELSDDIDTIKLIRGYIRSSFLGNDNVHDFLSKFIRYYKSEFDKKNISGILVDHMIDYITKKINLTIYPE